MQRLSHRLAEMLDVRSNIRPALVVTRYKCFDYAPTTPDLCGRAVRLRSRGHPTTAFFGPLASGISRELRMPPLFALRPTLPPHAAHTATSLTRHAKALCSSTHHGSRRCPLAASNHDEPHRRSRPRAPSHGVGLDEIEKNARWIECGQRGELLTSTASGHHQAAPEASARRHRSLLPAGVARPSRAQSCGKR
jgi:hypothetical protein